MDTVIRSAPNIAKLPSKEMSDEMQKKADPQALNEDPVQPRGRVRRFSFASGDRPLDGYTIKRGVGTGGFGEVYYATTDAGKEVALKRIERNLDVELRGVRQCLNLKHPNLVSVYDIKYDKDEQAWVVMEFVSGASLAEVVERNPNGMPLDEVNRWFDGISAGVAHLHESGIVHRDLKPGNIFSDQSTVKIGDYGLSKFISCSRRSGNTQSVGTFHYMAPEVGQGRYGKEIDIYALGIMLYEMLTGEVPYNGESSHEIIMKHLTATPVLTGIPQPYNSIIAASLAKDPAARKYTVADMREIVANQSTNTADGVPVAQHSPAKVSELAAFAPLFQGTPVQTAHNAFVAGAAGAFSLADEPVAQGITRAYRDITRGWQQTSFGTFTKLAILLLAIPAALANTRLLLPMVLVTVLTYTLYFIIRGLILYTVPDREAIMASRVGVAETLPAELVGNGDAQLTTGAGIAAHEEAPILAELVPMNGRQRRHARRRQSELKEVDRQSQLQRMRSSLRQKNGWHHLTDLLGSWILAMLVCGVAGLIFMISQEFMTEGSAIFALPTVMWAVMTSAVAASGLMFIAKHWESATGDGLYRRFMQLVVGMVTGCAAWGFQQYLQLRPNYNLPLEGPFEGAVRINRPNAFYDAGGYPTLLGFVVFFGVLFTLIRWWRQADPIRETRLSLWRTMLSGMAGLLVYVFTPVPGGILIALTTSVAVQIASTYMNHDERRLVCDDIG